MFSLLKKKDLGTLGENMARRYLKKKGYRFLMQNFMIRDGEIDLIFSDSDALVFVEVKTKRSSEFSFPYQSVTIKKQKKIIQVALHFIKKYRPQCHNFRFDVVSILYESSKKYHIEHFENAFDSFVSPHLF